MIIAEQPFLEHLLANTEGCNDFDIPYCCSNVSDVEITLYNVIECRSTLFVFFNKEEKKNWAQVNGLKNGNRKGIYNKKPSDFELMMLCNI